MFKVGDKVRVRLTISRAMKIYRGMDTEKGTEGVVSKLEVCPHSDDHNILVRWESDDGLIHSTYCLPEWLEKVE